MDGCLATPAKYKELKPVKAAEDSRQEFYKCSFSEAQSLLCFIYPTCCSQRGAVHLTLSASGSLPPSKKPSRCTSQECDDAHRRSCTQRREQPNYSKLPPLKKKKALPPFIPISSLGMWNRKQAAPLWALKGLSRKLMF